MTELTAQQKANIQRLSDAMRAGAAIRPQANGVLFRVDRAYGKKGEICSCAMGAAWEGAHPAFDAHAWLMNVEQNKGESFIGLIDIETYFELDSLRLKEIPNPANGSRNDLVGIIIDLNDRAKWTREEIADWLLTLI